MLTHTHKQAYASDEQKHICVHVHNSYKHVQICTHMLACVYAHTYMYTIHTSTCTSIHVCMHAYIHTIMYTIFLFVGNTSHSAIQACLEFIVYSKLTSSSERFSCSAFQILTLQAWGTVPVWSFPFHGPVAFFIFKLVGNCNLFIIHSLSPLQASADAALASPLTSRKRGPGQEMLTVAQCRFAMKR